MNQLQAMRDTVRLMDARLDAHTMMKAAALHADLQPPHLRAMLQVMSAGVNPQDRERGFSEGKMGRWLGWAQAAVVAMGLASLDDMKEINRSNS